MIDLELIEFFQSFSKPLLKNILILPFLSLADSTNPSFSSLFFRTLKLVVSIERVVSSMGINKDLSSDALMLVIEAKYVFFDKMGELTSGSLRNTGSFNYTNNNYANIVSLEDTSKKLVRSLSTDLADLILALNTKRKLSP